MTVADLVEKLNLNILSGKDGLHTTVTGGYTSDLLSDVMANANKGEAWITLHTHKNVMAVACLKKLACIILVKGIIANEDTLAQSNQENIPILSSKEKGFELAGKLYNLLK